MYNICIIYRIYRIYIILYIFYIFYILCIYYTYIIHIFYMCVHYRGEGEQQNLAEGGKKGTRAPVLCRAQACLLPSCHESPCGPSSLRSQTRSLAIPRRAPRRGAVRRQLAPRNAHVHNILLSAVHARARRGEARERLHRRRARHRRRGRRARFVLDARASRVPPGSFGLTCHIRIYSLND